MKSLFLILFFTMTSTVACVTSLEQDKPLNDVPKDIIGCIDKMGNDLLPTLNDCESKYLDYFFQKEREDFSFVKKKVFFMKGNVGTIKGNKKEYFYSRKLLLNNGSFPSGFEQLVVFEKNEVKYIGYDAVIISGSKKYLTKKEVIKRLKGKR